MLFRSMLPLPFEQHVRVDAMLVGEFRKQRSPVHSGRSHAVSIFSPVVRPAFTRPGCDVSPDSKTTPPQSSDGNRFGVSDCTDQDGCAATLTRQGWERCFGVGVSGRDSNGSL